MKERESIAEELARYRRQNLWPYLVVFILLLGGGFTAWYYTRPKEKSTIPSEKLYTVKKMDLVIAIEESATLRPKETIPVMAQIEGRGRLTVKEVITEGALVKKGDVIMQLDTKEFIDSFELYSRQLEDEEESIKKFMKDIEIQKIDNDKELKQADLDIARSKRDFDRGMTSLEINVAKRNLELRDKEIAVKDSEIALAKDEKNLEDTKELYKRGFASKDQLRDAELAVESRKNTLERNRNSYEVASKDLKVYLEIEVPQEKEKVQEALDKVIRLRDQISRTSALKLERLETQLKMSRERKVYKLGMKNTAKENIDQCTIKSPAAGTVVLNEHPFRGKVKEGDRIWAGMKVMEIPSVSDMKAVCAIPEFDIQGIRTGQKCTLRPDVRPDLVFEGVVYSKANAGRRDQDTGNSVFDVVIFLNGKLNDFIKPGMGARVSIIIEELKDRLCVPIEAVFSDDKNKRVYVFMYNNGRIEEREIKVGKSNDTFVEVTDGLKEDDQIFVVDPYQDNLDESSGDDAFVPNNQDDKKDDAKKTDDDAKERPRRSRKSSGRGMPTNLDGMRSKNGMPSPNKKGVRSGGGRGSRPGSD